jgi:branched-chain amino acid aminotransferase
VAKKGHQQALWLLGDQVIEVGSSNIFFVFKDQSGEIEIATPALEDLILPGITRDSILQLLRHEKQYRVTERKIFIQEVIERQKKGELLECFGAGTAVIISGVKNIEYRGVNYNIPVDDKLQIGPISFQVRQKILDIQEGRT